MRRMKRSLILLADRWVLSRLHQVCQEVTQALDEYRFNDAANLCYQFVWHEFCDWYLEMAKEGLYSTETPARCSTLAVLVQALKAILKLLHPFMPFVTEEIWQRLPDTEESIMVAPFPVASDFPYDEQALRDMNLIMGAITGIRNIRGEMNIPPAKKVDVLIESPAGNDGAVLQGHLAHIRSLARVESASVGASIPKPEASATAVFGPNQVHVLLKGLIDFEEEKKRIRKEIKKIEKDFEISKNKLSNPQFMEKAPEEIIESVREKVESMHQQLEKLNRNLSFFETLNT
jgi:valyl-tRNA synthetase